MANVAVVIHRTDRDADYSLLMEFNVDDGVYTTANWIHNPDLSGVASVVMKYWKTSGDTVVEMSAGEKTAADATIYSDHSAVMKEAIYQQIDQVTRDRIASGFTHMSSEFSLSETAQLNWTRLRLLQQLGDISYPLEVSTKDDDTYMIDDSDELDTFFGSMSSAIDTELTAGRDEKDTVQAMTTVAALQAWTDSRL